METGAGKLPAGRGARFIVHGRVQGVGYRWWAHRAAERLGVVGTVRNLRDGTVEAVGFGTSDQLDDLEQALRRGPPMSEVERIERSSHVSADVPADFSIVR